MNAVDVNVTTRSKVIEKQVFKDREPRKARNVANQEKQWLKQSIWKVMLFGVKDGPPTYQRAMTKAFREYLDNFMKIFLDDFMVYNDMENHLQNIRVCFQKCREYNISLNPNKCAFMVFSGVILGLLFPRKGNYQIQRKYKQL